MFSRIRTNWLAGFFLVITNFAFASSDSRSVSSGFPHFRDCDACSEMVVIPTGEYLMGATEEEFKGEYSGYKTFYLVETPRHRVDVKSFAIAKFSVTRKQFEIFANETNFDGKGCTVFDGKKWIFDNEASWRNPGFRQSNQDPVVCVSWDDVQKFNVWLNSKVPKKNNARYRLPTGEEWEYAARAGTLASSYWGGNLKEQCKYENARDLTSRVIDPNAPFANCNDGYMTTAPVGSFRPNPWGLFDMLGNVSQWISDCSSLGYSPSSIALAREAMNMFGCSSRDLRGGSWASIPVAVRSASRIGGNPSKRNSSFGFRLAIDLPN